MRTFDRILFICSLALVFSVPFVCFGLAIYKISTNHTSEGVGYIIGAMGLILFGALLLQYTTTLDSHDNASSHDKDEVKK